MCAPSQSLLTITQQMTPVLLLCWLLHLQRVELELTSMQRVFPQVAELLDFTGFGENAFAVNAFAQRPLLTRTNCVSHGTASQQHELHPACC